MFSLDENISTCLVFAAVFLLVYLWSRKPSGIPPGPALTLPFIGDLPHLIGGDTLGAFRKLRKKHGDIFSFYLGKDLNIVINGYSLIQRAAVTKGGVFSGRPEILLNDATGGRSGVIFTEGDLWKRQRKFTHANLQEFGFGKTSFEDKILEEVKCFIEVLHDNGDQPLDLKDLIHASVANIIFAIVIGKRHDYDDAEYKRLLHDSELAAKQVFNVSVLLSCAPFLRYVPGDPLHMKIMLDNRKNWEKYFIEKYEQHKDTIDKNNPRDLYDLFITEKLKQDNEDFSLDHLIAISRDLFGAGSETTATTIRWAILYLLKYDDIRKRLQSDIDSVIADNRFPNLGDKARLPYVEAFIMEVLRVANIAPLALPHSVTGDNDVIFEGYRIPTNCSILLNLDSVLQDPQFFGNPEEFNPARFIDSDGNIVRPKEFIPFGIGRRVCLGEAVAKMELFLFLTTMIKYFNFILPEGAAELDFEGVLGVTNAPKPYKIRAVSRN